MSTLILASASPRRKQLLQWAEIPFEIVVSESDESFPPEYSPEDAALHIAMQKAKAVEKKHPDRWILAADTIVVLNDEIIGKPGNREEAITILQKLSGSLHRVITAVTLLNGNSVHSFTDMTEVEFHPLTLDQIEFYVDKYNPYDKAGAYAIQEWIGVVGIKTIRGDFYNVMGLPVSRVVQLLERLR